METQDNKPDFIRGNQQGDPRAQRRTNRSGRVMGGLIIIGVGTVFLLRQMNVDVPSWIFTWPMILIVIGIYVGARHSFRNPGWLVPVLIGSVFLADRLIDDFTIGKFVWPLIIIGAGLFMIFRPRRNHSNDYWRKWDDAHETESSERLDTISVFGAAKKTIITKNFKGGEITNVFGGCDLNLTQADINGKIVLDVTNIFGGAKIIVPPHWKVDYDDVVCLFGGLDDKRQMVNAATVDETKVLVIKGTCLFGGIDIKSF